VSACTASLQGLRLISSVANILRCCCCCFGGKHVPHGNRLDQEPSRRCDDPITQSCWSWRRRRGGRCGRRSAWRTRRRRACRSCDDLSASSTMRRGRQPSSARQPSPLHVCVALVHFVRPARFTGLCTQSDLHHARPNLLVRDNDMVASRVTLRVKVRSRISNTTSVRFTQDYVLGT